MNGQWIRRTALTLTLLLLLAASLGRAQESEPQGVAAPLAAMGTAFTYQGRLTNSSGNPLTGTYDFKFSLYNAASLGNQVGSTVDRDDVAVDDGLFTVVLDFGGNAFTGEARWLEIEVKGDSEGSYTSLSPRQELTPAPSALALPGLWTQQHATSPNLIGGHNSNWVTSGVYGATISGGGYATAANRVTDNYGTVNGGYNNQAGDNSFDTNNAAAATIGGGTSNTANAIQATIGGGTDNVASGMYATIAGGHGNTATGYEATVGGGIGNDATGTNATIPGGDANTASGERSFAAGRLAQAIHRGAFVWADSTDATFASTAINQFAVRATGGVRLETSGAGLTVDGNTAWHSGNDGSGSGLDADLLDGQDSGAFWQLGGNASTTPGTDFLGTTDDQALELKVNNTRALRLEPHANGANVIGGYSGNSVSASLHGATIAGGGYPGWPNSVTGTYGAVGGGSGNSSSFAGTVAGGANNHANGSYSFVGGGHEGVADADYAVVGGGRSNSASNNYATICGGNDNTASGEHATVGGGYGNTASNSNTTVGGGTGNIANESAATVAGGQNNTASDSYTAIGGGYSNDASGYGATVIGGFDNTAAGDYSLAAGRLAQAIHRGAFVWADSTNADFASERDDQFRVRANGGVRFDLNNGGWVNLYDDSTDLISTSSGAHLTVGGAWTDSSDRFLKANFVPVDGQAVLAQLVDLLPITTWNYKAESASTRHMGPTAQDFYAAFGLGADDKHIAALDTGGVALAAIQGLYQTVQENEVRITALEQQNAELAARLAALEQYAGQPASSQQKPPIGWAVLAGLAVATGAVVQRRRPGGGR